MLCTQCRGIGPHHSVRGKSDVFFRVASGSWGIFSSYGGGRHLKSLFVQRRQDSYLVTMDTSGIKTRLGRTIRTLLEVRQETKAHFQVGTVILGFLSTFKKSQESSPFEALNSVCLPRYQSDVIPPILMRRRSMAFSRVCIGDSDFPSSCEMKHEPEFKTLQGNPAFF